MSKRAVKVELVRARDIELNDVVRPVHRNGQGVEIVGPTWGVVFYVGWPSGHGDDGSFTIRAHEWSHEYVLPALDLVERQVTK